MSFNFKAETNRFNSILMFSARVHSTIDANVWLKFVHWNFLLSRINDHAVDCRLFGQLETVFGVHIVADCNRAVVLFHFTGKCALVDQ